MDLPYPETPVKYRRLVAVFAQECEYLSLRTVSVSINELRDSRQTNDSQRRSHPSTPTELTSYLSFVHAVINHAATLYVKFEIHSQLVFIRPTLHALMVQEFRSGVAQY